VVIELNFHFSPPPALYLARSLEDDKRKYLNAPLSNRRHHHHHRRRRWRRWDEMFMDISSGVSLQTRIIMMMVVVVVAGMGFGWLTRACDIHWNLIWVQVFI
jgi:DNA-binding transcriptional LysR family regulator